MISAYISRENSGMDIFVSVLFDRCCVLFNTAGDKRVPVYSELEGLNYLSVLQQTSHETLRRELEHC